MEEHRLYTAEAGGSNPSVPIYLGAVVQLVRISACHAGGHGFKSRPLRKLPIYCLIILIILNDLSIFILNKLFLLMLIYFTKALSSINLKTNIKD